jgi:hypothetical protein
LNHRQQKPGGQPHGERPADHRQGDPDAAQHIGQTFNNRRQAAVHYEPAHSSTNMVSQKKLSAVTTSQEGQDQGARDSRRGAHFLYAAATVTTPRLAFLRSRREKARKAEADLQPSF